MFQQIKRPQGAIGDARRVFDGSRTTWQRDIGEVHKALVCLKVRKQNFTTPNSPIEPVTCAVERETAHGAFQIVLAHNGKNVCMVMLRTRYGQILTQSPLGGKIFRMIVAHYALRLEMQQARIAAARFVPCVEHRSAFQISHMLRNERLASACVG